MENARQKLWQSLTVSTTVSVTSLGFAQFTPEDLLDFTILGVLDPLEPTLRWCGRGVKELAVVELGFFPPDFWYLHFKTPSCPATKTAAARLAPRATPGHTRPTNMPWKHPHTCGTGTQLTMSKAARIIEPAPIELLLTHT